jgi:hypothetical protein
MAHGDKTLTRFYGFNWCYFFLVFSFFRLSRHSLPTISGPAADAFVIDIFFFI